MNSIPENSAERAKRVHTVITEEREKAILEMLKKPIRKGDIQRLADRLGIRPQVIQRYAARNGIRIHKAGYLTQEQKRKVIEIYQSERKVGDIKELCKRHGIPYINAVNHAKRNGYTRGIRRPPWAEAEITLLEDNTHLSPSQISKKLARKAKKDPHNYKPRSVSQIRRKQYEMGLGKDGDIFTSTHLAKTLGHSVTVVQNWIYRGELKAVKREADSGGSSHLWEIKINDFAKFARNNPARIIHTRLSQPAFQWLIRLIAEV